MEEPRLLYPVLLVAMAGWQEAGQLCLTAERSSSGTQKCLKNEILFSGLLVQSLGTLAQAPAPPLWTAGPTEPQKD